MLSRLLLPEDTNLAVENVAIEAEKMTVSTRTTGMVYPCPDCGAVSGRVHSRYRRTIADFASGHRQVTHSVQVRRFFCDNEGCHRRTFVETPDGFAGHFARRSTRLAAQQQAIGRMVGGEPGAALSTMLAMPVSGDTIRRLVRDATPADTSTARVIGVDDWAWRKGSHYGTIIVDLERHQAIDLLPDRSAESLAMWLKAHPHVEIVSRDRARVYIDGINLGAPNAIQVADRWHLLRNFGDMLVRLLDRHRECLVAAAQASKKEGKFPVVLKLSVPKSPQSRKKQPAPKTSAQRQRRLQHYRDVLALHKQGHSIRAISRQLSISRQTVRRYLNAGEFPEIARPKRVSTALSPYLTYLQTEWQAGKYNAAQLFREIYAQGYRGSYRLVRHWKTQMTAEKWPVSPLPGTPKQHKTQAWSAYHAVPLLFKERDTLTDEQQYTLEQILKANFEVRQAYNFGQSFVRMIKYGYSKALEPWLEATTGHGPKELRNFAKSLQRDKAAVLAAMSLPWSNGQVEGQVNRLKIIKRQMYGRAKFDLLRLRVLAPP